MPSRRAETSFVRAANFLGQLKVAPNADGTITVELLRDPNGEFKKYEEISPLLFRELHGQNHVAFKPDANGRMVMSIDFPFFVFQRPSFADNKNFNLAILIPSVTVLALTLLFWPVAAAIRWHYGRPLQLTRRGKRMRFLVRLVCLVNALFLLGWVVLLSRANDPGAFNRRLDIWILLLMILGVIGAFGTLIVLINAVRSLRDKQSWLWTKVFDVAIALACVGFTWFIWHWNLINFNLRY